ncbi:MAG: PilN domain-containing protein [Gammaproteobacteria bacterium]|nr:PilN domain-containing protein [Gammaproteobacteria bacterium]
MSDSLHIRAMTQPVLSTSSTPAVAPTDNPSVGFSLIRPLADVKWLDGFGWQLLARLRKQLLGDTRAELANSISDHLVVCGESMLHLESGKQIKIDENGADCPLELPDASVLATTVSQLLSETDKASKSDPKLELLLDPSEFLATSHTMPGVSADNLSNAIALQRENLLPACEIELVLAVAAPNSPASEEQRIIALWFSAERLSRLHHAFAERGLSLIAVRPRILCANWQSQPYTVVEQGSTQITAATMDNGQLTQWLQTISTDLEQTEFAEQWQSALASLPNMEEREAASKATYTEEAMATGGRYRFYPAGALAVQQRIEKSRQLVLAASLLIGLLLLSAIPFLLQSVELGLAQSRLQSTLSLSADARADQAVVVNFENEWGVLNDFPDQQLRQAMFRLQELLAGERLTSLELNEGLIRIQGTSSDPQAILQRLEQDPLFTEVVFSRATNNTRYYIDLYLATVSFEAYMVRYFPD